jgi:hypothetical protein
LQAFPDAEFSVAVVWIDVLGSDNKQEALKATARFSDDPRVRFFYDREQVTGEFFMQTIPELAAGEIMAWDVYMFYETDAQWTEEQSPRPVTHMYQLGGDKGKLPRNIRGKELAKALRETMAAITGTE